MPSCPSAFAHVPQRLRAYERAWPACGSDCPCVRAHACMCACVWASSLVSACSRPRARILASECACV
eukprot:8890-Alexandrium_andersonii.AAC.1